MKGETFPVRMVVVCVILVVVVSVSMTLLNRWMDKQLEGSAPVGEKRTPTQNADVSKPSGNPYGSNVKIDPLNDPLAPTSKVRPSARTAKDVITEKPQEPVPVSDILVQ